ncbi:MAG TPA: hypothetical protein EYP53_10010 [Candidatus Latescibacteria bacterium]|nr:hypothetical protein [Candidatus Latescibacterota bacterium]
MKTGVSYFGNRIPDHVREDLQNMVDHGPIIQAERFTSLWNRRPLLLRSLTSYEGRDEHSRCDCSSGILN